jgi:hypothetical protein
MKAKLNILDSTRSMRLTMIGASHLHAMSSTSSRTSRRQVPASLIPAALLVSTIPSGAL